MAVVKWYLRTLLEQHNLTAYQLAKAMNVAPNNIYRYTNHTPKSIELETTERILTALHELTGSELTVGDLLEYQK